MLYKIVETDSFGGYYPEEEFLNLPLMPKEDAEKLADLINELCSKNGNGSRCWLAVDENYKLDKGIEM